MKDRSSSIVVMASASDTAAASNRAELGRQIAASIRAVGSVAVGADKPTFAIIEESQRSQVRLRPAGSTIGAWKRAAQSRPSARCGICLRSAGSRRRAGLLPEDARGNRFAPPAGTGVLAEFVLTPRHPPLAHRSAARCCMFRTARAVHFPPRAVGTPRAFIARAMALADVIPTPADYFIADASGHQWNSVLSRIISRCSMSSRQRFATALSTSSSVLK